MFHKAPEGRPDLSLESCWPQHGFTATRSRWSQSPGHHMGLVALAVSVLGRRESPSRPDTHTGSRRTSARMGHHLPGDKNQGRIWSCGGQTSCFTQSHHPGEERPAPPWTEQVFPGLLGESP